MPLTYKRIIEETASDEIFNDDWFLKDSPSNDTKKIQGSVLKRLIQSGLKEMLTQTEYNALPSTKLSDNVIYYITDTSKIIINGVIYGSGGGGASALIDLSDVNITTPSNGQVLQYDSSTSKWINANSSGGGGSATFSGTSEPTSAIGGDGDLYFQYKQAFKYIKMSITANRDSDYLQCQFADIRFEDSEGTYFDFSGATATCNQTTSSSEGPAQCIDNNLNTKINMINHSPSVASPDEVTIYIPNGIDFSIYNTWSWWTSNDTRQRDPISWKLYVSNDGNTWELLDEQTNYNVPTERKVRAYSKQLGEVGGEIAITNKYVKINSNWVEY